jgi:LysM repeat protein
MNLRHPFWVVMLALAVPATAAAQVPHTVAPGESLSSIAAADGLTVSQLAAENGVSTDSGLLAGATILIPPQSASPEVSDTGSTESDSTETDSAATTAPASSGSSGSGYVVQPGDTLSAIAARSGLSISELAAENGLDLNGLLLAGRSLTLGGGRGDASSAEPVADTQSSAAGGPYPTATSLSPDTVGSIGAASGASASLTEGVGYNESGFNNDEVSDTGAVGIMQIEPSTWSYINQTLTPGARLDPYSATDNVRGGALYLQSLINQTGSVSDGVAAYNEGLGALRNFGVYPSTQQYVNNVLADQERYASGG